MTVGSDSFCLIFFDSLLPYLKSCYIQMPIFGKFNTASIGFFFFFWEMVASAPALYQSRHHSVLRDFTS